MVQVQVSYSTYSSENNQVTYSISQWTEPELTLTSGSSYDPTLTSEENQRLNELANLKSMSAQWARYSASQKTFCHNMVQDIQSIMDQLGEQLRDLKDKNDSYQSQNEQLQSQNEQLQSQNEQLQSQNEQLQELKRFADELGLLGEEKSKDFADIIAATEAVKLAKNQVSEFRQQAIQSAESAEQAAFASSEAVQAQVAASAAKNAAEIVERAAETLESIKITALNLLLDRSNDSQAEAQTIEELRQQAETEKQKAVEARNQAETAAADAERFAKQTTQDYDNWDAIRTIFHLSEPVDTAAPASSDLVSGNLDGAGSVDNWDAIQDIFGISSSASMRP